MSTKIDQKAYLRKYLGGHTSDKKKKKKKVTKGKGFKIIDDDIDLSKLRALEGDELDILGEGEDAPQIAGIIDERPEEVKKLEQFKTSSKWRVINQDDGFNSKLQIEEIKKDIKEVQKENELVFGKMYSDSEDEEKKKKKNDSDASPPRKNSNEKSKNTTKPTENSDSDVSPPRKNQIRSPARKKPVKDDSDPSPPRKHDNQSTKPKERTRKPSRWGGDKEVSRTRMSDNDQSPPRKSHKKHNLEISPSRKQRKNFDSDASPPRKKKNYDSDASPPRKARKEKRNRAEDSDQSPPRRRKSPEKHKGNRYKSDDMSSNNRYGESSKQRRKTPDSDLSPPRKKSSTSRRQSPSFGRKSRKSPDKPSRRKNDSDSDPSPPRRGKDTRRDDRSKPSNDSPPPSNAKMARTLEGKMAGLQDATQLREENEAFRRREEEAFRRLADETSGRNAKAVSRKGKRETSEERNKQKEKAERQKELDEKYKRWGKGLKQLEAQETRVQDFLHEASKPLARHRDDRDLESSLKRTERDGDPMLRYIRERKRERGELPPEKPMYKGNFPPNRFNIRPGYRWDGVDRSNGYEKKFFDQQSKKKAQEEEAYKWSTEDL